jgi:flagellar L-ring protein precursor FlgH
MNARSIGRRALLLPALLAALAPAAWAQKPPATPDTYDVLYQRYLRAARSAEGKDPAAAFAWMASLTIDPRARAVNDLLTVRVIESITAAGTADSSLTKKTAGSASVAKMFGLEKLLPKSLDPTSLASTASDTNFQGSGSTARTGELTATMTVRVAEVLPNGDLVLEGAREIDINGDRQMVVLTGVVRQADVIPPNVVLSTQIGQLSIRYFGRGLMKDNMKPGWLIRVLNKVF